MLRFQRCNFLQLQSYLHLLIQQHSGQQGERILTQKVIGRGILGELQSRHGHILGTQGSWFSHLRLVEYAIVKT